MKGTRAALLLEGPLLPLLLFDSWITGLAGDRKSCRATRRLRRLQTDNLDHWSIADGHCSLRNRKQDALRQEVSHIR